MLVGSESQVKPWQPANLGRCRASISENSYLRANEGSLQELGHACLIVSLMYNAGALKHLGTGIPWFWLCFSKNGSLSVLLHTTKNNENIFRSGLKRLNHSSSRDISHFSLLTFNIASLALCNQCNLFTMIIMAIILETTDRSGSNIKLEK